MKFLHCADLHIDSPLRGLSAYEGAPVDDLRGATRRAFENLVDVAVAEGVTAVVIAGDMYDGDRDDYNTAMFLNRGFVRLVESGIRVFVINGNHDAANEISRRLRPPDGVHVFGHRSAETVIAEDIGLCLHGQSYATRAVSTDLSASYPAAVAGLCNVGVLHTSLSGREGPHERYAPCTEGALFDKGYDYWALGHVHERYVAQRDDKWVVYPGNLQGRHIRERGPKGATLVTYSDVGVTSIEHRDLDVVRWYEVRVDVSQCGSIDDVLATVASEVMGVVTSTHLSAVRVRIVGGGPVAGRVLSDREVIDAQIRADVSGSRVFVERIRFDVSPGDSIGGGDSGRAGDSGEARSLLADLVQRSVSDPTLLAEIVESLAPLRSKLAAEAPLLTEAGLDMFSGDDGMQSLLEHAHQLLLAELDRGATL